MMDRELNMWRLMKQTQILVFLLVMVIKVLNKYHHIVLRRMQLICLLNYMMKLRKIQKMLLTCLVLKMIY